MCELMVPIFGNFRGNIPRKTMNYETFDQKMDELAEKYRNDDFINTVTEDTIIFQKESSLIKTRVCNDIAEIGLRFESISDKLVIVEKPEE